MQPLEDDVLVSRVLDGDTEQFSELVRRYQVRLYRYAVSMVGDHDIAADMVQDAFVRAYTNLGSCRDRSRFQVWLFRTLRNRCFDHLKDPRRRHVALEEAPPPPDPAESVQREAFLMHYVEGVPYDEMAGLLGASVSALKMRVLRAREALSAELRKREVTDQPVSRLSIRRG
jgi:RNA polymerase sigma-70 factor (ECF subfamily)